MKRFLNVVKWGAMLAILFFILLVSSSCSPTYKQALVDDYLAGEAAANRVADKVFGAEELKDEVKADSTKVEGELIIEPYDLTKPIDDQ
jgi:hypothetical protein